MDLSAILTIDIAYAAGAGFLGAFVRGFTGFGANLIWAPVLVILFGPVEAVAIMGLAGLVSTVQLCVPAARQADWHEIWPIVLMSLIAAPLGVFTLYHVDAEFVRRGIGFFVLIIALILMKGWRYTGDRTGLKGSAARIITGILAGWLAGFGAIGGPIPVLYFMAAPGEAAVQRANNVIAVSALVPMVLVILIYNGDITEQTLMRVALLIPTYLAGTWLGAHSFRKAPAAIFRKAVLVVLIVIGISALAF